MSKNVILLRPYAIMDIFFRNLQIDKQSGLGKLTWRLDLSSILLLVSKFLNGANLVLQKAEVYILRIFTTSKLKDIRLIK